MNLPEGPAEAGEEAMQQVASVQSGRERRRCCSGLQFHGGLGAAGCGGGDGGGTRWHSCCQTLSLKWYGASAQIEG